MSLVLGVLRIASVGGPAGQRYCDNQSQCDRILRISVCPLRTKKRLFIIVHFLSIRCSPFRNYRKRLLTNLLPDPTIWILNSKYGLVRLSRFKLPSATMGPRSVTTGRKLSRAEEVQNGLPFKIRNCGILPIVLSLSPPS